MRSRERGIGKEGDEIERKKLDVRILGIGIGIR